MTTRPYTNRIASVLLVLGIGSAAQAATLCVNPPGASGCTKTIAAAVSAAKAGDTIDVAAGTYAEDVVIGKPLSLVGAGSYHTTINATGLANGIYIDGLDNPGLVHVNVTGFTVSGANFEGILIVSASDVSISENLVTGNNRALNVSASLCPGIPAFETSEGQDCGEGIHLMGVDHSVVQGNTVESNSGGILSSDETAATHDNLIAGNTVRDNAFACGITLASHPPAPQTKATAPFGIYHNTISGNNSSSNGLGAPGAGAGVGIFAPGPGNQNYGNVVVNNTLTNNGLPGVTMHNHAAVAGAPAPNLNDNMIIGNTISGNAADTQDALTGGPTGINLYSVGPVTGTVIAQNIITNEAFDVVFNAPGAMEVHLNELLAGRTGIIVYPVVETPGLPSLPLKPSVGVANLGTGTVNATLNYWGCAGGPGTSTCTTVQGQAAFAPWLTSPAGVSLPFLSLLAP
jgi:parallel beta-helix repeat protein